MARVIKFRGWDKVENIMCPVKIINLTKGAFLVGNSPTPEEHYDRVIVSKVVEGHFVKFKHLVLMQFIGETDKNGKEIYEGDIFEGRYGRQVVFFHDCGFVPFCGDINVEFGDRVEVLGNIWENPDLLRPEILERFRDKFKP